MRKLILLAVIVLTSACSGSTEATQTQGGDVTPEADNSTETSTSTAGETTTETTTETATATPTAAAETTTTTATTTVGGCTIRYESDPNLSNSSKTFGELPDGSEVEGRTDGAVTSYVQACQELSADELAQVIIDLGTPPAQLQLLAATATRVIAQAEIAFEAPSLTDGTHTFFARAIEFPDVYQVVSTVAADGTVATNYELVYQAP